MIHRYVPIVLIVLIFCFLYRYTLAFTFGGVLQKDLDAFLLDWNVHPIRQNRLASSPHGCPDDIYDMPALYGKKVDYYVHNYVL